LTKFEEGFNNFLCHTANAVNVLIYGETVKESGQIWLGINGVENEIDRIIIELETSIPEQTGKIFIDSDWIDFDYPPL